MEPLIERAFNELTFELRPIVQKSIAIVLRFGGEALSEPAGDVEASAEQGVHVLLLEGSLSGTL